MSHHSSKNHLYFVAFLIVVSVLFLDIKDIKAANSEWLSSTAEFSLTDPYLVEQAANLNHNPEQIFKFVRDEIAYEAYEGSLRGARGALWSKAGNSLDQSSLLIALLRISGIPARYASGTLDNGQSKNLINSMFDPPLQMVGCPTKDAERADPQEDPKLLALVARHYWVEYEQNSTLVALDPAVGTVKATRQSEFTEVPDALRHKLKVSVNIEKTSILHTAKEKVLDETFTTAELTGRPISFGHFVDAFNDSGLISSATTYKYTPYLLIGDNTVEINNNEIREGTAYQEFFSTYLAIANTYLQGVVIEIQTISPSGEVKTFEKALLDRLGYATRANNSFVAVSFENDRPALSEADLLNINVIAGSQAADVLDQQKKRSSSTKALHDQLKPQIDTLPTSGSFTTEQATIASKASDLGRKISIISTETIGMMFNASADELQRQLQLNYQVKAYFDSPRLLITKAVQEDDQFNLSIDILKNDLKTIAVPEQVTDAPWYFEIARGYMESQLEDIILGSFSEKNTISAMGIFNSMPANTGATIISSDTSQDLLNLSISEEALARISNAINNGKIAIAPDTMITINGVERYAWIEIDAVTGHTIAVSENGDHGALLEYAFGAQYAKDRAGFVGGWASAFSSDLLSFASGLLEGANEGLTAKAIVAKAKERMKESSWTNKIKAAALRNKPVKKGVEIGSKLAEAVVGYYANYDPSVFPFLSTAQNFQHTSNVTTSTADLAVTLKSNNLFYYPTTNPLYEQLPTVYQLSIKNNGPQKETVKLNLTSPSKAFTIGSSLDSLTIPAGETAEVSVCLTPIDETAIVPNASLPFSIEVTGSSGTKETVTGSANIAPSPFLQLQAESKVTTESNVPVTSQLQLTAVNAPISNIKLSAATAKGLTLTGLPTTLNLNADAPNTLQLTFTPAAAIKGKDLWAQINASYEVDGKARQADFFFSVSVRSKETLVIESCSDKASAADNTQLTDNLSAIALLTSLLQQNKTEQALCTQLAHKYHQLAQLAAVNPGWSDKLTAIQELRDTANNCEVDKLVPNANDFFTHNCVIQGATPQAALNISLDPPLAELQPNENKVFTLTLKNNADTATTYNLTLATLPANASATLSRNTITLQSGEQIDATSTAPITINVKQTLQSAQTFPLTVTAKAQVDAGQTFTDTSLIAIRPSLADVLKVSVSPDIISSGLTHTQATAQILNTANIKRSLLAKLEILNEAGIVIRDLPTVPTTLQPSSEPTNLDLGNIAVADLVDGKYRLRVSLLSIDGTALPGKHAETLFFKGAIIAATATNDPIIVPPGDSTVKTTLNITNLASLSGVAGSKEKLIQYHTADAVIESLSTMASFIGDVKSVLGTPKEGKFVSLNTGTLVIDLGEEGNLAIDGPGDDFMILEENDDENYEVFVGKDTNNFISLGTGEGISRFDLATSPLREIRFIKLVDQGNQSSEAPGADIAGVRVLNSKKGIKVERVNFNVGTEGLSAALISSGILTTPIVANIDTDPTPEILISTDMYLGSEKRFVALDGLTANEQFSITENIDNSIAVAVAELRNDNLHPEIVLNGPDKLRLLASTGKELWSKSVSPGGLSPVIANVDQDPDPEIISDDSYALIISDTKGSVKWRMPVMPQTLYPSSIVTADLNSDGLAEILTATILKSIVAVQAPADLNTSKEGILLWETQIGDTSTGPAVADIDGKLGGDANTEIIIGSNDFTDGGDLIGVINIINHDGTILKRVFLDDYSAISPPSIADINGDGVTDIIFSEGWGSKIYAISLNAEVLSRPEKNIPLKDVLLWSAPAIDATYSGSGISVYDLDGDGIWEVVWNGFGWGNQKEGGLQIHSGIDGSLIYQNPRINSRTWDENVTIADIDGDGHAELITGDQEGLWIIGADDLWVKARDVWNQENYHITNINDDLTVPVQEIPSWSDHNTYRTQRPPSSVINRLAIDINHGLGSGETYTLDTASILPLPDSQTTSNLKWKLIRSFTDPAIMELSLSGVVKDMLPGETRQISTGTAIIASYLGGNGQKITETINLPPVVVAANQFLSLTPATNTLEIGESANFILKLTNPSASNETFKINLLGLGSIPAAMSQSYSLSPKQTIEIPFSILATTELIGTHAFTIEASTTSAIKSTVGGEVVVNKPSSVPIPEIDLDNFSVDVQLSPQVATAGQGTSATYQIRLTNTGDQTDNYRIDGEFPAGFSAQFSTQELTVLPGINNFKYIELTLTPDVGIKAGSYNFKISALSKTNSAIKVQQAADLLVSNAGVKVELIPQGSKFILEVTNTGLIKESFNIALSGAGAIFSSIPSNQITLESGQRERIDIDLLPLNLVLPGTLSLTASATAQSNNAINAHDTESLSIVGKSLLTAAVNPASQTVKSDETAHFQLVIQNKGNAAGTYKAKITLNNGVKSSLIYNNQLVQEIPRFYLGPFSTALLNLDAAMEGALKEGSATIEVSSVTDPSEKVSSVATLSLLADNNNQDVRSIPMLSHWLLAVMVLCLMWLATALPVKRSR